MFLVPSYPSSPHPQCLKEWPSVWSDVEASVFRAALPTVNHLLCANTKCSLRGTSHADQIIPEIRRDGQKMDGRRLGRRGRGWRRCLLRSSSHLWRGSSRGGWFVKPSPGCREQALSFCAVRRGRTSEIRPQSSVLWPSPFCPGVWSSHPLECGCAGDVISRIPLTSQEMPLWEGKVQTSWEHVNPTAMPEQLPHCNDPVQQSRSLRFQMASLSEAIHMYLLYHLTHL